MHIETTVSVGDSRPVGRRSWAPWLVWLGFLGLVTERIGGYWDGSWHLEHVRDYELTPPHLVLYSGGLVILATAIASLIVLIRKGGLREGIRQEPTIALVAVFAFLQISSAPLDNTWHRLFGIDVSVWSPPHAFLVLGMGAICVSFAVLQGAYIHKHHLDRGLDGGGWNVYRVFQAIFMGSFTQAMTVFVIEPELPGIPYDHPHFALMKAGYTTVVAGFSVFALAATARLIRRPFAMTIAAATFTVWRAGMGLMLIGHLHAAGPAAILLPAIALDLYILRRPSRRAMMVGAAIYAVVLSIIEVPYTRYITGLPPLNYPQVLTWLPVAVIAAVIFAGLGYGLGNVLARMSVRTTVVAATEATGAAPAAATGTSGRRSRRLGRLELALASIAAVAVLLIAVPTLMDLSAGSQVTAINSGQKIRESMSRYYYSHDRRYPNDVTTWDDLRARLEKFERIPAGGGSGWELDTNGPDGFAYSAIDDGASYVMCVRQAGSDPHRLIISEAKVTSQSGTCQDALP